MNDQPDAPGTKDEEIARLKEKLERERQKRERLQNFLDRTGDAIMVHDLDGRLVDTTRPTCELLGYSEEQLLDLSISDLVVPFDASVAERTWEAVVDGGHHSFESEMICADGSVIPVEVELRPFEAEDRDLVLGICRDITNRRRAETMLEAREQMYQTVFRHSVEAIYVADVISRRVLQANPAFCELLGYGGAEALGLELDDFVVDSDSSIRDYLEALGEGESISNLERTWRRKDGTEIEVELTASGMQLPNSDRDIFFVVARDITEEKELRTRMIQMDRMIAMGTLAAGVGHEINNPLSYIIANLQFTNSVLDEHVGGVDQYGDETEGTQRTPDFEEDLDEIRDALAEAEEGARRIHEIVGDLKRLAGPEDDRELEPVSVERCLQSSVNIVWNEIRNRADFEHDIADLPPVWATESRLSQVFVNLLVNAAQAIPPGEADENEIRVSGREEDGGVVIRIRDTGRGIPPEDIDRIFDPFFTTKEEDQGTGLGLSICRRIVDSLGGTIEVDSVPEEHTVFTVRLKAVNEQTFPSSTPKNSPLEIGRNLSIFVIDRDEKIGHTFRRLLDDHHELDFVTSWGEAKTELSERREVDVVFCDLMLPNATAIEIYQWMKRQTPGILTRLVFMTGDSFTERSSRLLDRIPNPCLLKPFSREELMEVIAEVLAH